MSSGASGRTPASRRLRAAVPDLMTAAPAAAARRAAAGRPVHLVGGALRDGALGMAPRDWDVVVAGDGEAVARRLAADLGGTLVALGGDRWDSWRIVAGGRTVDLWDRRGADLAADLRRRDLTIHALALDLEDGRLIDPTGGLEDLDAGLLRAPSPRAFAEDPLRVLRLARLYAHLEAFRLDDETARAARRVAGRVEDAAPERVREELELGLDAPSGERFLAALRACGLFPEPIPGGGGSEAGDGADDGAMSRRPQAARTVRRAARGAGLDAAPAVAGRPLHLALLIVAAGADPEDALSDLRRRGWIRKGLRGDAAAVSAWRRPPRDDGAMRWLLHESGELWTSGLVLAAALRPGSGIVERAVRLVRDHGRLLFSTPPWLDGREVGRLTGLPPGPRLGELVRAAYRWQVTGEAATAEEARERLKLRSAGAD